MKLRRQFPPRIDYDPSMAKRSKLLAALDAHKGVNHKLENQKKQQKQAEKRKRSKEARTAAEPDEAKGGAESEGWESDESELAELKTVCRFDPSKGFRY